MRKTLQDLWSYSESSRMTQRLAKQIKQLEESEKIQRALTKYAWVAELDTSDRIPIFR
jgi:hypothetical protein